MNKFIVPMTLKAGAAVQRDLMHSVCEKSIPYGFGMLKVSAREIGPARARKLKRRGEFVWLSKRTSTGRVRYLWLCNRVVRPSEVYR